MEDNTRKFIQKHLGFDDKEMEIFLGNPKNLVRNRNPRPLGVVRV